MRAPILLFCSATFLLCACGAEQITTPPDAGPCPPCESGEVCDPVKAACVVGLTEGSPCETAADGGVVEGLCGPGMVCAPVSGGVARCSINCTARTKDKDCGPDRSCFARPDGSGRGFCGLLGLEAEPCDVGRLIYCGASLTCITPAEGVTAGRCFATCVPGQNQCPEGRSCADPFLSAPTFGFCVVPPGGYPNRCDHSTLAFCGEGEVCVRPSTESWGYCHRRCASEAQCPGASCVDQLSDVAFCAEPVARCPTGADPATCDSCDAAADAYCGSADACVRIGERNLCRQRCDDDPAVCPEGSSCVTLQGSDDHACL
jgi:hypothetical protein